MSATMYVASTREQNVSQPAAKATFEDALILQYTFKIFQTVVH